MKGNALSTLIIRIAAAVTVLRGTAGGAAVLGMGGGPPFESLALSEQAKTVAALLADVAAGTALWLLAPWGVVLWSATTAVQAVLAAVSGRFLLCAVHVVLATAVLVAVRRTNRAADKETFRFS